MSKRYFFNGIDGSTGKYLLPPLSPEVVAALAREDKADENLLEFLKDWSEQHTVDPEKEDDALRKPVFGNDAKDLAKTGWGVIYAPGTPLGVKRALEPLLLHRKEEATRENDNYYQVFEYETGESVDLFLQRNGARPDGAADPDRGVPYYLLLVGDPESIPYQFQYELDVRYAVGRIHFENEDDYEHYADSVIAAERRPRRPREVAFFGPKHEGDPATESSAVHLIELLGRTLIEPGMDWKPNVIVGSDATKARLGSVLGGPETPALLLAACHGVLFPHEDERQVKRQGGLICQDWPGPKDETGVMRGHYFTADDLAPEPGLLGLVTFLVACYGAGTPDRDNYYDGQTLGKPRRIASRPFVSALCQRLLSHSKGGALAVVGHVDRAWSVSFEGSEKGEGADNFKNCLTRLLEGHTVGAAVEYFNQAYAALATRLSNRWEARHRLEADDWAELADLWLLNNDARNYVLFGDPAVKLSVD